MNPQAGNNSLNEVLAQLSPEMRRLLLLQASGQPPIVPAAQPDAATLLALLPQQNRRGSVGIHPMGQAIVPLPSFQQQVQAPLPPAGLPLQQQLGLLLQQQQQAALIQSLLMGLQAPAPSISSVLPPQQVQQPRPLPSALLQQRQLPRRGTQETASQPPHFPALSARPTERKSLDSVSLTSAPSERKNTMGALVRIGKQPRGQVAYMDVLTLPTLPPPKKNLCTSRGGVSQPFPYKVHCMLSENNPSIQWLPHGRAFQVIDADTFVETVLTRTCRQTKWESFRRQLNLYGFGRITRGPDAGSIYHELFLRYHPELCLYMQRVGVGSAVKGEKVTAYMEPNLHDFPPVKKPNVVLDDSGEEESIEE